MRPLRVAVVDYESGNLLSVSRALEKAGVKPEVTGDPDALLGADAVVFPGVGAGDAAMAALRRRGLVEPLRQFVASQKPFLGICLGLQLLMDSTDEGDSQCLGIIQGRTKRLPDGIKVPHMGWNTVNFTRPHPVFQVLPKETYFYFVHSYYAEPADEAEVVAMTDYGVPFCSALARGNLVATQFHPEKSGPSGLEIYRRFVTYAAELTPGTALNAVA